MNKRNALILMLVFLAAVMVMVLGPNEIKDSRRVTLESGDQERLRSKELTGIILNPCKVEKLGINILCDYAWEKVDTEIDAAYFVVSEDPAVTFKVVKVPVKIYYIQQLNRDKLRALGHYKEGFGTTETKVAGFDAIQVSAFSAQNHAVRLTDYYFVHKEELYVIMFSVEPKDKWDNYQPVFRQIVQSLKFDA